MRCRLIIFREEALLGRVRARAMLCDALDDSSNKSPGRFYAQIHSILFSVLYNLYLYSNSYRFPGKTFTLKQCLTHSDILSHFPAQTNWIGTPHVYKLFNTLYEHRNVLNLFLNNPTQRVSLSYKTGCQIVWWSVERQIILAELLFNIACKKQFGF